MSTFKKPAAVIVVAVAFAIISLPQKSYACACGCGVFDVGTNTMYPAGAGGTVSFEYDFMDQKRNWSGSSSAPSANNDDKRIRSDFYTAGVQYMFDRAWGMSLKVPYTSRAFDTDVGGGDVEAFSNRALGDVRVSGIYTGFSADMSTGVEFGVKLPTGNHTYAGFDRDTSIGSGSTDALVGLYHRDRFGKNDPYNWFLHGTLDLPVLTQGGYRPGTEFGAAAGVAHDPVALGSGFKVAPVFQLINTYRNSDSGVNANGSDSGYDRVLLSPGLEFSYHQTKLFADVSVPVYQHVTGNQLVAPIQIQAVVSYDF